MNFSVKFFQYDRGLTASLTIGNRQYEMVAALRRYQPLYFVQWTRCSECGNWIWGGHSNIAMCEECTREWYDQDWSWYDGYESVEAEYEAAMEELDRLMVLDPEPGSPEDERLELLVVLVQNTHTP